MHLRSCDCVEPLASSVKEFAWLDRCCIAISCWRSRSKEVMSKPIHHLILFTVGKSHHRKAAAFQFACRCFYLSASNHWPEAYAQFQRIHLAAHSLLLDQELSWDDPNLIWPSNMFVCRTFLCLWPSLLMCTFFLFL